MAKFEVGDIVEIGRPGGEWGRIKALVSDDGVIPRYEIETSDDTGSIYPEYILIPVSTKTHKFRFPMAVDILGTEYTVKIVDNFGDEPDDRTAGYTDPDMHLIQLRDLSTMDEWKKETVEKIEARQKEILRHEIVHAYLNESGLKYNSFVFGDEWAHNEEMVDWFAIQGPKILETW